MEKKKFEKPKNASAAAASSDEIFKIPKITREPANKQMKIGQKLILRIEAQGVPSPTYQWFQNGIKIPGAVSNSFVIVKTRGNNGGAYTCEVKNFVGSVMSKSAMISFFSADKLPPLKIQPENLIVPLGKSCKFSLVGVNDDELKGVHLQWFFNGRKINGVTGDTLEFTEVKKKYEGEYKVIAVKNSATVASNTVKLVVTEAQANLGKKEEPLEVSMADVLLSQELPSIQLEVPSLVSMKIPVPPPVPFKPEGDALLDSLNGEDTFFDPGEDEAFFEPDEEIEASDADDLLSQLAASMPTENSDSDELFAALLAEEAPEEKKSPIVVVQGAPEPQVPAEIDAQALLDEVQTSEQAIIPNLEPPTTIIAAPEPLPEPQVAELAPIRDEQKIQKLLAKKDFLEKLLLSVATMKQRAQTPAPETENPFEKKIARQKLFLTKLRENVLAKKKEAA